MFCEKVKVEVEVAFCILHFVAKRKRDTGIKDTTILKTRIDCAIVITGNSSIATSERILVVGGSVQSHNRNNTNSNTGTTVALFSRELLLKLVI